ncbi:hypothetical protein SFC07_08795 [Corynebacterium callunae]|uniref:hypothetical protein n=1 Tax=Corynebacterium callunae TaxID=1721 RepID=UPI0039820E19
MKFPQSVPTFKGFALLAMVSVLTACGGVTVDGDSADAENSGAASTSLAREGESSASTTAKDGSTEASTSAKKSSGSAKDGAAAEVSEIPTAGAEWSAEEQAFLDGLKAGGVNIDGIEGLMVSTASNYCNSENKDSNVTPDAVAGQLIVQGRTKVTEAEAEKISTLLKETAERTYC